MGEFLVAVDPVVCSLAVQSPVRFVGVDCVITAAKLFGDVIDNGIRFVRQHGLEANQRRQCERDAELLPKISAEGLNCYTFCAQLSRIIILLRENCSAAARDGTASHLSGQKPSRWPPGRQFRPDQPNR